MYRSLAACLVAAPIALSAVTLSSIASQAVAAGEVNIYSERQEVLIRPLLDRFTKNTGIKVNVVFIKTGSLTRLKAEGRNSPADVVLTADAARLIQLDKAGLLQPSESALLTRNIPAKFRHPEGKWYGLAMRARPIMYNPATVKPGELSTYAALADPKWRGRICVRSSTSVYNLSLLSSMIAHEGPAKTLAWAKGFVANFARSPKGGDRDQIRAVAAGECDIAIANTYYLAQLAKSTRASDRKAAATVKIYWPNQNGSGAHVNISGAGLTKYAPHKANAIKLIEFLSSDAAQKIYAETVNEYPVKPGVPASEIVASWGEFKADDLPLANLGTYHEQALRIADQAGWR